MLLTIFANSFFSAPMVEGEVLRLYKVSRLDMGAYMCIASNGVPPAVSKRINLGIDCKLYYRIACCSSVRTSTYILFTSHLVPPMMWVPAQQISAIRGESEAKLVCYVEAHPEALTFWEKDNRMLQSGTSLSMTNHHGSPKYKVDIQCSFLSILETTH